MLHIMVLIFTSAMIRCSEKSSRLSTIIISSAAAASWLHSAQHFNINKQLFCRGAGVDKEATCCWGYRDTRFTFAQHRRQEEIFNPVVNNQWRRRSGRYWLLCGNAIQRFVLPHWWGLLIHAACKTACLEIHSCLRIICSCRLWDRKSRWNEPCHRAVFALSLTKNAAKLTDEPRKQMMRSGLATPPKRLVIKMNLWFMDPLGHGALLRRPTGLPGHFLQWVGGIAASCPSQPFSWNFISIL